MNGGKALGDGKDIYLDIKPKDIQYRRMSPTPHTVIPGIHEDKYMCQSK